MAFFKAVGYLVLLLTFVGVCFWLAERRANRKEFRPGIQGIGDGFWFSAVTMTTTGYGDMAPRTWVGRLVGLVWMFAALIITSSFTGMIASALTAQRLEQQVEGPNDLYGVSTGSIKHSAADEWLGSLGIVFVPYESGQDGLAAIEAGEIQSFVYDRPLLHYMIENAYADTVELVPGTFGREDYGIVLPAESELREPLNRALLSHLGTIEWTAQQRRWVGQNGK